MTEINVGTNMIIVTSSEFEVQEMRTMLGKEHDNTGFYGEKRHNFEAKWYWILYKNGELSGTSGYRALEDTIARCYGFELHNLITLRQKIKELQCKQ